MKKRRKKKRKATKKKKKPENNEQNGNKYITINNYFNCEWIKFSSQKT